MIYQLIPELAEFGSRKELLGKLDVDLLNVGGLDFHLSEGIDYSLELTNTGEGIVVRGKATTQGWSQCVRCLEDAHFSLTGEVESYYVLNSHRLEDDEFSDEFCVLDDNGAVDLSIPIKAAVVFELPQVLLCEPNCQGLCSQCGTNLNLQSCDCANAINEDSPFYALKNYK